MKCIITPHVGTDPPQLDYPMTILVHYSCPSLLHPALKVTQYEVKHSSFVVPVATTRGAQTTQESPFSYTENQTRDPQQGCFLFASYLQLQSLLKANAYSYILMPSTQMFSTYNYTLQLSLMLRINYMG